ncbi:MAG: tetratricopeptide repeat protein [Anaerolineales bacterium]|nr:tetratricopeptide repeat protein [Anaerolineales bacterium]
MHTTTVSPRFVHGLLANLRYWQAQTAVINDALSRQLDPDFPNAVRVVEMGLVLPETWRETAVLILQCFFWVEGSGRIPQWRPLVEKCLAAVPIPDDWLTFRLLKQLGQFQRIQWELATAVATFQQARTVAHTLQDTQAIAEIHMNLCQTYQRQHRYEEAQDEGEKALALFAKPQHRFRAAVHQTLGQIARGRGQYSLAEGHFQQALALFRACETITIADLTRTMNALAWTYQDQKQFDKALHLYEEINELLADTGKVEDKIGTAVNLGSLLYSWQKYDQAEAAFRRAETMLRSQPAMTEQKAHVANNLGCVLRQQQIWDTAEHYHHESIRLFRQLGSGLPLANAIGNLGKLYMLQGRLPEALACFVEARQLVAQFPDNAWAVNQMTEYTAIIAQIQE